MSITFSLKSPNEFAVKKDGKEIAQMTALEAVVAMRALAEAVALNAIATKK